MSPPKAKAVKPKQPAKPRKVTRTHRPDDLSLEQWQIALRRQYASEQEFRVKNLGAAPVFSEFSVTNPATERTYRVAIRGEGLGVNFCSCPDYATNTLGTCKHIEFVLARLRRRPAHRATLSRGFVPAFSEVYLRYGLKREVIFALGRGAPPGLVRLAGRFFDESGVLREEAYAEFDTFLRQAAKYRHELRCYDDALEFIAEVRDRAARRALIDGAYGGDGKGHDLAEGLLKTQLYPYQLEGALFAARAGRALLGDEMGLGKTVQALAFVEIMARHFGAERALIICPASLKHQWKQEIERFTDRAVTVIEGFRGTRREQYGQNSLFKVLNYELVFRDRADIAKMGPDIVILDEAQRIKNWQTRTARSVKAVASPYALVLTGTPLENRLGELHSIVEFIDRHRLGPLFRFLDQHQVCESGTTRVVGYRDLGAIGQTLAPILLRRSKEQVRLQLPERTDKNFFVAMTPEQRESHEENREVVARLVAKWRRYKYISEADQRRLLIALQNMRMSCDNTFLIDHSTRFGPKLDELMVLLGEIFEEPGVKAVVFSQWTRMNDLVAERLAGRGWGFVYLHGGVPTKDRRHLITRFREEPDVRVFLSTDAGGVGLNLQAASVVINLDLPWNPAVLEQRVGRAHRIGQHRMVRVVNYVSGGTIEHGMLDVLRFKRSLFAGALDGGPDEVSLGGTRLAKFMETIEEVSQAIPAAAPVPPADEAAEQEPAASEQEAVVAAGQAERATVASERVSGSLNALLTAAASFIGELTAEAARARGGGPNALASLTETDPNTGRSYLKLPLPAPDVLAALGQALAPLLGVGVPGPGKPKP